MANVLQEILTWAYDRPTWQRDGLRRLVLNGELTTEDIDALTAICKGEHGLMEKAPTQPLAKEHVPERGGAAQAVSLESIFHHKGVNALAEDQTLKFGSGLTIVYGDNGAGKTGYIRILKQACRARGQEEILGNVVLTGVPRRRSRQSPLNIRSDPMLPPTSGRVATRTNSYPASVSSTPSARPSISTRGRTWLFFRLASNFSISLSVPAKLFA